MRLNGLKTLNKVRYVTKGAADSIVESANRVGVLAICPIGVCRKPPDTRNRDGEIQRIGAENKPQDVDFNTFSSGQHNAENTRK